MSDAAPRQVGEPWTLQRAEDDGRLWMERRKFFSNAELQRAESDLISEWLQAYGEAGDLVMSDAGVQITVRHYEEPR